MTGSVAGVDIMFSNQLSNRIGNLKVHSQHADNPALRMHISNAFSSLDIQPQGMPPSAILIVRKIYDPLPGILRADSSAKYGRGNNNRDSWQIALRSQLSNLYHQASRPAKAAIVGEQDAVLFGDHAELLACFCRDIIAGAETEKWWWKSHFGQHLRTMAPVEIATRHFVESPRCVPAVFKQLAEWHCAIKLVKMIDATTAQHITQAVLHEFGLSGLDEKLRNSDYWNEDSHNLVEDQQMPHVSDDRLAHISASIYTDGATMGSSPVPPWLDLFDTEIWEPVLSKEQLALLGIARLLQNSPMTLRRENFQKQVADWWSVADKVDAQHQDSAFQTIIQKRAEFDRSRKSLARQKQKYNSGDNPQISFVAENIEDKSVKDKAELNAEIFNNKGFHARSLNENDDIQSLDSPLGDNFNSHREQKPKTSVERNTEGSAPLLQTQIDNPNKGEHDTPELSNSRSLKEMSDSLLYNEAEDALELEDDFVDVESPFSDTYFDTKLGGLLYLINLLKQLDLPDCLSELWNLDQQISRWALLDAISRALLGKKYFAYSEDPVWSVLAGLERRRKNTAVGNGFQGQVDYYMPKEWFHYIAEKTPQQFYWALHHKQLRVWSEIGVVIERKVTDFNMVESQVIEELQKYSQDIFKAQIHIGRFGQAPIANRRQLQVAGIDQEFARLLSFVLPPIHRYLQDVLSLTTVTPCVLLDKLLRCDGRIYVSSSHIDLVTNINSTTLVIRRSGLDQDPGWLPLYGRVVLFHFSQA